MSLPGLKPTIEMETEPALRLVDRATGDALVISETESRLLARWDGVASATDLSASVFVEGLDVEPWQVEQFFSRLARAGLLENVGPVVPDFVPAPSGIETAEDTVPCLRGDLIIKKSPTSRGTLEVTDPLSERTFTLYDFEVSIARMLDGKRSAAEVLSAANRLGIPVNLATLRTFLQQLKAYKFIDQSVTGGDSTWPRRQQWTVEVRELYQGALRLLRQGKYDEALGYVDAMKEADPGNQEALALRARIEAEAKGSLELKVDFETLHTPVTTAAVSAPPEVVAQILGPPPSEDPFASFGFHSAPPPADALPPLPAMFEPPAPAPAPNAPEPDDDVVLPPARSRRGLFIGGGLMLVVALGVLLRPVEVVTQVPCELQVETLGVPRASKAGTVKPLDVKTGTPVEKDRVLARIELSEGSPMSLQMQLAEVQQKLDALPKPAPAAKVAKARAVVKKAQAAVTALEKQKRKASKKALVALEKKLKPKQKALELAQAALDALTADGARAGLMEELRALTAKKAAAEAEQEQAQVVAPVAGLFLAPLPAPEHLAENDAYGQIVGPQFKVTTSGSLEGAQTARFRSANGELEVTLEQGTARAAVTPALVGAKGTLELAHGKKPWLWSLF